MAGLEAEVALIVKAPNQQTDDFRIRAASSWSIRELKAHLAEVYPSKPSTNEQKIIYSGQLLDDDTVLRDVLRVYDGLDAYTVHLVCAPGRLRATEAPPARSDADGPRRRIVAGARADTHRAEPSRPETRQNDQNHTAEMQNYLGQLADYGRAPASPAHRGLAAGYAPPADPVAMANHVLMMQQAYLQYMQQYANMWQAAGTHIPAQPVNTAAEPAPQAAAAAPAQDAAEDDADAPRDWLDWLYATSRLAILFSLLYFYSSPLRLLLVMLLAVLGYLYQLGFFREAGVDMRNEPARPQDEPPRVQPDAGRAPENTDGHDDAEPTADAADRPTADSGNQQSYLAATWMIFSSFFTSLIPDTPNVI